jgi:Arc/MetJ family transcription regulator
METNALEPEEALAVQAAEALVTAVSQTKTWGMPNSGRSHSSARV